MSEQLTFGALKRLGEQLRVNGIEEEQVAVILGTVASRVVEQVVSDMTTELGQERMTAMQGDDIEQTITTLSGEFEAIKGMSLADYREQVAEQVVQQFESLA